MDQCTYGYTTPGSDGAPTPAKKPAWLALTSAAILKTLFTKSFKNHEHQHLVGCRAAAAAFYPRQVVKEIIRCLRDTIDMEEPWAYTAIEMPHGIAMASIMNVAEATVSFTIELDDLERTANSTFIKFKYADGRFVWRKLVLKPVYT